MRLKSHDSITLMQQQATLADIDQLYHHGHLNQQAKEYAIHFISDTDSVYAKGILLLNWVGGILIMLGLGCILALHWQNMSVHYRTLVMIMSIGCCWYGAWTYHLNTLKGKLLLAASCLLIGLLLQFYTQAHQLNIDYSQVFLAWALLTLPLVLMSKFPPLWIGWVLLLNASLYVLWSDFHTTKTAFVSIGMMLCTVVSLSIGLGLVYRFMIINLWLFFAALLGLCITIITATYLILQIVQVALPWQCLWLIAILLLIFSLASWILLKGCHEKP